MIQTQPVETDSSQVSEFCRKVRKSSSRADQSKLSPAFTIKVDTDKLARAQSVTPLIEAGRVFLAESAPWLNDELAAFPKGTHDDCVDSVTQALNYLRHEPQDTVAWWPVRL